MKLIMSTRCLRSNLNFLHFKIFSGASSKWNKPCLRLYSCQRHYSAFVRPCTLKPSTSQKLFNNTLDRSHLQFKYCTLSAVKSDNYYVDSNETDALLEQMRTKLDRGQVSMKELSKFICDLQMTRYHELSTVPWLHTDNIAIAFMQLVINDKIERFLGPVLQHHVLQQVLEQLRCQLDEVPDEDCPSLLIGLISLGVDETDPLVAKLLGRLIDSVEEMDIIKLARVAEVLKSFPKGHVHLVEKMIHRFQEILNERLKETNEDFIKSFCGLHIYLFGYMSKDLSEQLSKGLLSVLEKKSMIVDPSEIGACLRYCRKIHFAVGHEGKETALKIARHVIDVIPKVMDNLLPRHLAEICHHLKKIGLYRGSLMNQLQEKSLQILTEKEQDSLYIRDIVNISYAFNKHSPNHIKKILVSLMVQKIDDVDVLVLSNMADVIMDTHEQDPALIRAFQLKTLDLFDNLSIYVTRFHKVLRLLSRRPSEDETFQGIFQKKLLRLLDGQHGINPWSLSIITLYMLPNVKHIIPQILMDRLMVVIPQCNLKLMSNILDGLNLMQKPWLRELHNQVLDLRICIQRNIAQRIDSVADVETIIPMITGLYLRTPKKEFSLLEKMMKHLPSVTQHLTLVQFLRTVNLMKRVNYYHPEVFENLVRYLMNHQDEVKLHLQMDVLEMLARAGYSPQGSENFSEFCSDLLDSALETDDIVGIISLAFDLCQIQIFPEAGLSKIFTFEFLEEIDGKVESRPEMRNFLEGLMMKLNRSVVLECPQLDVPWFHDEYCANKVTSKAKTSYYNGIFELDVEQILNEELGGKDYFKTGVFSPYYYYINFEILLDKKGQPVAFNTSEFEQAQGGHYQRVAVLVLPGSHFCTNSSYMIGYHQSKIRHLELLGYKVVLVPHYEWRSMALTDRTERANYLREKICSS